MRSFGLRLRLDSAIFCTESGELLLSPLKAEDSSRPGIVHADDMHSHQPHTAFKVLVWRVFYFFLNL